MIDLDQDSVSDSGSEDQTSSEDEIRRINEEKINPPIRAKDARAIMKKVSGDDLRRFPDVRYCIDEFIRGASSLNKYDTAVQFPILLDTGYVNMSEELLIKLLLEYRERKYAVWWDSNTGFLHLSWYRSNKPIVRRLTEKYKQRKQQRRSEREKKKKADSHQEYLSRLQGSTPAPRQGQEPMVLKRTTQQTGWGMKRLGDL